MNIYNGNVTTDANGYVTVEMPEYFEAANKEFRYQLTVIGTFAQAIIKEKMAGKLKNATEALKESAKTVKEAVMIGNLLGKAIDWCGEQWIEWMI